jgi:hypothetical protein
VNAPRPDRSRRVTPDLMDYHKANAPRLRAEACAEARRRLHVLLKRLLRRP